MAVEEFTDHISSKGEGDAAVIFSPALDVLVGVRPQQITQEACVRHVCGSHDASDLLHRLQVGRKTSVTAEDLLIHYGCDGQAVEAVGERLPQLDVESAFTLIIEAVDAVDGGTLVVAPEQEASHP